MWNKALLYFFLLSFMNTAFLFKGMQDANPFDEVKNSSREVYSSIAELVIEGWMGVSDNTPEDEEDISKSFKAVNPLDYFYNNQFSYVTSPFVIKEIGNSFTLINPYSCILEKSSLPPKFA